MPTHYTVWLAIIPAVVLAREGEHHELRRFLFENGAAELVDGDVHFRVQEADCCDGYSICGASRYRPIHGSEDDGDMPALLSRLIQQNKICLVYEDWWSSGGCDYEDESIDPILVADQLPSLVLQELIARRQEREGG